MRGAFLCCGFLITNCKLSGELSHRGFPPLWYRGMPDVTTSMNWWFFNCDHNSSYRFAPQKGGDCLRTCQRWPRCRPSRSHGCRGSSIVCSKGPQKYIDNGYMTSSGGSYYETEECIAEGGCILQSRGEECSSSLERNVVVQEVLYLNGWWDTSLWKRG